MPSPGNRFRLCFTSSIVEGNAFLRARRERIRDANTATGTPVVFAGGGLTFKTDDDMRSFGDNLLRTLNAVRERVGDMYRSEEHTSELQSLMRISYAVFCLKKKKKTQHNHTNHNSRPA